MTREEKLAVMNARLDKIRGRADGAKSNGVIRKIKRQISNLEKEN